MLKAIIFDLDDTLLMTRQTKYEALKFAGKNFYKLEISDADINALWGKPFQQFIYSLYRRCDTAENMAKCYKSILPQFPNKPYSDTVATLDKLGLTHELGILSSAAHDLVTNDLVVSGVGVDRFCFIQSEEDTTFHKPEPEVFDPTIEQFQAMGIMPHEMLYLGDTFNDYLAASGAGLDFIGIPRIKNEKDKMLANKVQVINTLADINNLSKLFPFP